MWHKAILVFLVLSSVSFGDMLRTYEYSRFTFTRYKDARNNSQTIWQTGTISARIASDSIRIDFLNKSYSISKDSVWFEEAKDGGRIFYASGKDRLLRHEYMAAFGTKYVTFGRPGKWMLFFVVNPSQVPNDDRPGIVFGSGFGVDRHTLVTNNHVVENSDLFVISNKPTNKKFLDAEVIYRDPDLDLAVLRSDSVLSACPLDRSIHDIGEEIYVYGFPQVLSQGTSLKLTKGIISSKRGYKDDAKTYQIDAAVQPGNSGGPLVRNGRVVGVVSSMLLESQNVNYAIKSSFVADILDVLEIKNSGTASPKTCTYFIIGVNK